MASPSECPFQKVKCEFLQNTFSFKINESMGLLSQQIFMTFFSPLDQLSSLIKFYWFFFASHPIINKPIPFSQMMNRIAIFSWSIDFFTCWMSCHIERKLMNKVMIVQRCVTWADFHRDLRSIISIFTYHKI